MCIEYKKLISILFLLFGVSFSVNCMEDNHASKQGRVALPRRDSEDIQTRQFGEVRLDQKALSQQSFLSKTQESIGSDIILPTAVKKDDRLELLMRENNQLEENNIFVINLMLYDEFKNAVWRQEIGDFFQERQSLLEKLRLSSERYQILGKEILSLRNNYESLCLHFSEIYSENEKLNKDKKIGLGLLENKDVQIKQSNERCEQILQQFTGVVEQIEQHANEQMVQRGELIRFVIERQAKSEVMQAKEEIVQQANNAVMQAKEEIVQRANNAVMQAHSVNMQKAESMIEQIEQNSQKEVNDKVEIIKNNMLAQYKRHLNKYKTDARIKMFCLGFLALVFFLDARYDLKSFFIHA